MTNSRLDSHMAVMATMAVQKYDLVSIVKCNDNLDTTYLKV